jgi:hypothetical protein
MAASMAGPQWAGNFDCSGCGRKRLVGAEFSKASLEKHRRDSTAPLRCKACVEAAAEAERRAAAEKQRLAAPTDDGSEHMCSACEKALPATAFNRSQLSKGPSKQRCQPCVAAAEKVAASASDEKYRQRLEDAQQAMVKAEKSGDVALKVSTASLFAAVEAEKVTGLKPVKLGAAGRGRGRGGRGRGR